MSANPAIVRRLRLTDGNGAAFTVIVEIYDDVRLERAAIRLANKVNGRKGKVGTALGGAVRIIVKPEDGEGGDR